MRQQGRISVRFAAVPGALLWRFDHSRANRLCRRCFDWTSASTTLRNKCSDFCAVQSVRAQCPAAAGSRRPSCSITGAATSGDVLYVRLKSSWAKRTARHATASSNNNQTLGSDVGVIERSQPLQSGGELIKRSEQCRRGTCTATYFIGVLHPELPAHRRACKISFKRASSAGAYSASHLQQLGRIRLVLHHIDGALRACHALRTCARARESACAPERRRGAESPTMKEATCITRSK